MMVAVQFLGKFDMQKVCVKPEELSCKKAKSRRDVIEPDGMPGAVLTWCDPGKTGKVVNEVGLIKVAAIKSKAGPPHILTSADLPQGLLKALNAVEILGPGSHLFVE